MTRAQGLKVPQLAPPFWVPNTTTPSQYLKMLSYNLKMLLCCISIVNVHIEKGNKTIRVLSIFIYIYMHTQRHAVLCKLPQQQFTPVNQLKLSLYSDKHGTSVAFSDRVPRVRIGPRLPQEENYRLQKMRSASMFGGRVRDMFPPKQLPLAANVKSKWHRRNHQRDPKQTAIPRKLDGFSFVPGETCIQLQRKALLSWGYLIFCELQLRSQGAANICSAVSW